jgi:hypothetical protein
MTGVNDQVLVKAYQPDKLDRVVRRSIHHHDCHIMEQLPFNGLTMLLSASTSKRTKPLSFMGLEVFLGWEECSSLRIVQS